MKEGKIKNIVDREVKQLQWMLKHGQIDKQLVTFDLFIEGIVEDFHVPEDDMDLLKEIVSQALKEKDITLSTE
ncbi:hypothetical protein [Sediminitomix flava]|uniref:Uncharacterized protein n=1 Tax=Sediminitomix flava TaxID=379075 RepID=A0A315ZWD6_SEDFL|nr:hypothetical protein [Sediminitomix flava]PWJ41003.1 hypothetical protein BC781_104269 [Sediminitomix flava]